MHDDIKSNRGYIHKRRYRIIYFKVQKKVDFLDELMEELKNKSESIERFVDLNEPSSEIRIVVNRCSFQKVKLNMFRYCK